jgi:hypothetical protein
MIAISTRSFPLSIRFTCHRIARTRFYHFIPVRINVLHIAWLLETYMLKNRPPDTQSIFNRDRVSTVYGYTVIRQY